MRLEILREESAFLALEPWWDRLLEQSATPTPFMRWDWVRLWWQVFGHGYELAMAVVYDEQKVPQAIAPLMLGHDSPGPRRHLRHLGFLGGLGPVRGERMDFLVPAGREARLVTSRRGRSEMIIIGRSSACRPSARPRQSASSPRRSSMTMSPEAGGVRSGRASAAITT